MFKTKEQGSNMKTLQYALNIFCIVYMLFFVAVTKIYADEPLQVQLQKLQIITENYPPIGFRNKDNEIVGMAVEVVQEIMLRLKMKQQIKIWPWARAYIKTIKGPNFVLFSASRTKEREPLFHWVGSIFTMRASFYVKKGSGIRISNLNDARKVKSVGTYREAFDEQFLKKEGFTNLEATEQPVLNMKKLMKGRLSAVTATNITVQAILKEAGFSINDVEEQYTFLKTLNYIVFSRQISNEVVNAWRQTLKDIKDEGLLSKLQKKWFP